MLRDGYAAVLDDHRRILRAACDAAGGREVDAHGDAFFAVFARTILMMEAKATSAWGSAPPSCQ